ncbi:MAG: hypothetical protein QFF03_20530 [Pseudomonadota bacterium]|nr:hypothetical protein [Pseudomonadota bacterium]
MNALSIALMVAAACLPIAAYVTYKWFKIFNSPDGERYMKRRAQGPFVPLSADELSADGARKR